MSYKAGTVVIDIKADTAKLVAGMDKAQRTVTKSIDNIKTAIISMAAAYAGIESVRAFGGMISDSIDAADNVGKLAQKLGMTTEELSKLQYTAQLADVSNGELTAGLSALIRRLNNFQQDGGGAAKDAFAELGISAEYAREHLTSTDAAFKEIIKRLEEMPDGYKKTAIAQDIFSKSASGLLKITATDLQSLGDEAQKIGLSISQGTYEMAAAYHDQMDQLDARLKGIKQTVAFSVIAPMDAASKTAVDMYDEMFDTPIEQMQEFESIATNSIKNVANSVGFIKDAFTGTEIVINGVEIAFLEFVKSIQDSSNYINSSFQWWEDKLNNVTGKKTNFFNTVDTTATMKIIDDLKKETESLIKTIHDGRDVSDNFSNNLIINLKKIKKEAEKTSKAVGGIGGGGKKSKNTNDIKKDNAQWIKDLQDFYNIDIEKGLNDQGKKVETTFQNWGDTLNSSISNSIVDALQSGDVMGAIQGLGSSFGSSVLQSSTTNLVGNFGSMASSGTLMSMGGFGGMAAGLGIGALSGSLFGGSSSKPKDYTSIIDSASFTNGINIDIGDYDNNFSKFIDGLDSASAKLEDFGNVGSAQTDKMNTLTNLIDKDSNLIKEYEASIKKSEYALGEDYDNLDSRNFSDINNIYFLTKDSNRLNKEIDNAKSELSSILSSSLADSLNFDNMSAQDASNLIGDFDISSYNNVLEQINELAIKAKQQGGELSDEDNTTLLDLYTSSLYTTGQDYADAISIIDDALNTSKDNIKLWEDSFKSQDELAQDMANNLGVTLATTNDGLNSLFDTLKGGVDGLNDAESDLLMANKALIDANNQAITDAFLGSYSPLTLSQKTDYANSIASGAIPSNLSDSESYYLALQTTMNSAVSEDEATRAFNRYIADISTVEPDSTRTDIVNELRSNRETLNDIANRLDRLEA